MAVLLPKYPSKNPDIISINDSIRENSTGLMNNPGKKPRDKPFDKTPTLLITKPSKIIIIEAPSADITLKNTPWYIKGFFT